MRFWVALAAYTALGMVFPWPDVAGTALPRLAAWAA